MWMVRLLKIFFAQKSPTKNRGCQGHPNVMSSESNWSSLAPLCPRSLGSSENWPTQWDFQDPIYGGTNLVPYFWPYELWGDSEKKILQFFGSWNGRNGSSKYPAAVHAVPALTLGAFRSGRRFGAVPVPREWRKWSGDSIIINGY